MYVRICILMDNAQTRRISKFWWTFPKVKHKQAAGPLELSRELINWCEPTLVLCIPVMVELFKIILGIVTITSLKLDLKGNCTGQRAYKTKKNKKRGRKPATKTLTTLALHRNATSGKKRFAHTNPHTNTKHRSCSFFT